jgi:hypothetical protein
MGNFQLRLQVNEFDVFGQHALIVILTSLSQFFVHFDLRRQLGDLRMLANQSCVKRGDVSRSRLRALASGATSAIGVTGDHRVGLRTLTLLAALAIGVTAGCPTAGRAFAIGTALAIGVTCRCIRSLRSTWTGAFSFDHYNDLFAGAG